MAHRTKNFTLQIPYDTEHGELGDNYTSKLFDRMLKTYREFGHVIYNEANEESEEYITSYMARHNARVYECYGSRYLEAWRKSIESFCAGYSTQEEALASRKRVAEMRYEYERAMSCPIMSVTPSVVEDSDGTYKITLDVKYDTSG